MGGHTCAKLPPITFRITFKMAVMTMISLRMKMRIFKTTNFSLGGVICGFLFQNFKSDHKERKSVGHYQNNLT